MSGAARRLTEGVWHIRCRGVNAYLLEDDVVTLVDAGTPWDGGRLRAGIDAAGHAPDDVERVLLTHYDVDHVGGLTAFDAPVHARDPDASHLVGETKPSWTTHKGALQRLARPFAEQPPSVERVVDGDVLGSCTAYATPGHTPGHTAYVSESLDVAFLGDLVRERDGRLAPSPWLLSQDTDAVSESIRRLQSESPPFAVAAVGHGDPLTTGGRAALDRL